MLKTETGGGEGGEIVNFPNLFCIKKLPGIPIFLKTF